MDSRISVDPDICGGQPCIKGTRIAVYMILDLIEAGYSFERIIKECYPQTTEEDIKACVRYANELVKEESVILSGESR